MADDAFAGWVILGPTITGWRDLDLPTRPVRALRNGTLAGENRGQDALGDPCQALVGLAQDRAVRGTGLKSGEVVITGTRVAPVAIHPGDRVSFEFPDLGEISAAFDWSRADRPVARAKPSDYFFLPPADAPGLAWAVKGLGAAPPFGLFCFGFLGSRPLRF